MRECPHGIFVFFLVTGCISLSSHICMHVCICLFAPACVRICVYVYAYLCNVCVWGAEEGMGVGGGGGGRCARVRIHTCYYGCSHILIYFVFLYVSIDICGYFYM